MSHMDFDSSPSLPIKWCDIDWGKATIEMHTVDLFPYTGPRCPFGPSYRVIKGKEVRVNCPRCHYMHD